MRHADRQNVKRSDIVLVQACVFLLGAAALAQFVREFERNYRGLLQ